MGGRFNIIHVVDIARCMELWHKECIGIPEFCLYKPAIKFFKTKRYKLVLYALKKLNIRIASARKHSCRWHLNIVRPEMTLLPCSLLEHLRRDWAKFFASHAKRANGLAIFFCKRREPIDDMHTFGILNGESCAPRFLAI